MDMAVDMAVDTAVDMAREAVDTVMAVDTAREDMDTTEHLNVNETVVISCPLCS